MTVRSCLYEGRVVHRRTSPVDHEFRFPLFMVYLDLEELDAVFDRRWLWSTRRAAFARFDRRDHVGSPEVPLGETVRALVADRTGHCPQGRVGLLTNLRYAGYLINPVSFYYCWDESGEHLETVVADVTNTPWNERYTYVLDERGRSKSGICASTPKEFHVSPFMQMDLGYRFTFTPPGERLAARIENLEGDGDRIFDALLTLERREICGSSLARSLVLHPFMTAQAAAAIYWQALRLYTKGAPFYAHPEVTT
jgi:DUF1365 family protein